MDPIGRYTRALVRHRRVVLLVVLVATIGIGAGAVTADWELTITEFDVDSEAAEAQTTIDSSFDADDQPVTLVVVRGEESLSKAGLLETMAAQRAMRDNETIADTLESNASTVGVGNAIAIGTDPRLGFFGLAPIDAKMRVLENRTQEQIDLVLRLSLEDDSVSPPGQPPLSSLLPTGYHPDDGPAEAQLVVVVHDENASEADLIDAQRSIERIADAAITTGETSVVAQELAFDRGAQATSESFALIGPLALLVVIVLLAVAYRDPIDVLLGCLGLALALLWTAGLVGWLGLEFNQLLVAVPCLLVGLGIDYGLHVVMRYREELEDVAAGAARNPERRSIESGSIGRRSIEHAMAAGLAGVLVAIGATTATTAAGFLVGYASPIEILRTFGLVVALGIVSAFVVFATVVPALKVEIDAMFDRGPRSGSRSRGSVGSLAPIAGPLRRGVRAVDRAPIAVVAVALLLAIGGAAGAAGLDTSTDRNDFLPESPPAWTQQLPASLQPTDYGTREAAAYADATFGGFGEPTVDILITGDVVDPGTLEAVHEAEEHALASDVSVAPADGTPTVYSPLDSIGAAADADDDLAVAIAAADTDDDGIPDRDLAIVYDAAYEGAPDSARTTIHRTDDGEYRALRMIVTVDEEAESAVVASELRDVAELIDSTSTLNAVATGGPILEYDRSQAILDTVLVTFLLALFVIAGLLSAFFRYRHGSWVLGPVTIAPVVIAIAWLLGTMSLLSIPFNAETALITAIAIGLGTDYTIHVTERFLSERRAAAPIEAIETAVVETGGVVLASALTTAAGFAVLTLTVIPSLQRFGIVTALVVVYAVVATIVVLPGLLVLWERSR